MTDKMIGEIRWMGCNAEGKKVSYGVRSSSDPLSDLQVMTAAIELVDAIKLRNVHIHPLQLYKHLVGKDYVAPPAELAVPGQELQTK